jgi:hypothetical protein
LWRVFSPSEKGKKIQYEGETEIYAKRCRLNRKVYESEEGW